MKKKAGLQAGKKAGIRGKLQNVKANKMQAMRGGGRFGGKEFRA